MTGVRDYQNFVHSDLSTLLACSVHTGSSPQRASGIQSIATLSQSLHDNEKIVAEMVPLAVRPQEPVQPLRHILVQNTKPASLHTPSAAATVLVG
jgi:hypothetical protein